MVTNEMSSQWNSTAVRLQSRIIEQKLSIRLGILFEYDFALPSN